MEGLGDFLVEVEATDIFIQLQEHGDIQPVVPPGDGGVANRSKLDADVLDHEPAYFRIFKKIANDMGELLAGFVVAGAGLDERQNLAFTVVHFKYI